MRLADMEIGCILYVIHVAGTRMKRSGIYVFYQGDLLEGMMNSKNPLEFIPLNDSADESSGGRLVSWVTSWRKYNTEAA